MPGFHSMRWLIFVVCGAHTAFGCASDTQGESGSLSLELVINGDTEIDEVQWVITRGGEEIKDGVINTSANGATASVEAYGLPPGDGYTIMLEAVSTDGETTCKGKAMFSIQVGEVTEVHVMMNCKPPRRFGGVRVNGEFNICPVLRWADVSPLQTSVGNDIDLFAMATDEEGDAIAYMWSSGSGIIVDPMAASTTYTCTEVGGDEITILVTDDGGTYCMDMHTVPITCVPGDGDPCEGVICEDTGNECTAAACNPGTGECETSNIDDGTSCNEGAGTCMDGTCVDADLCMDVQCPDLGECQDNTCNPQTGECEASNVDNGTSCNQGAGMCMDGTCVQSGTTLAVDKTGPPAAFANQEFQFTVVVSNTGPGTATNVVLVDDLPDEGTFVSSDPAGLLDGDILTVDLGDIVASESVVITITWQAPDNETTLLNDAEASADNAAAASDSHAVEIGIQTVVTGGVTAAGTGLRNRDNGDIAITGVPAGAVVTRAVLTWALLYTSPVPGNQITFEGEVITADLTQTISANLCWGDTNTIGYAADVTGLVSGNGIYSITDPVNTVIREDSNPSPTFPLTDGATLIVFYGGIGFDDQVLSDFSYSAESTTLSENVRNLEAINSTGGAATLYLTGPDGQGNFGEEVRVTGSGELNFDNTWDGSDPQEGPDFAIGNLWDTDVHDVTSILPAGQTTLDINLGLGSDCTGLSAVALQVAQ